MLNIKYLLIVFIMLILNSCIHSNTTIKTPSNPYSLEALDSKYQIQHYTKSQR